MKGVTWMKFDTQYSWTSGLGGTDSVPQNVIADENAQGVRGEIVKDTLQSFGSL